LPAYPAINSALGSGPNTYYFRTRFNWNFLPDNVAFVVTNCLSDGAVYYLNGAEFNRIRMPSGAVGSALAPPAQIRRWGSPAYLEFRLGR
jgi:hypothetical protein